MESVQSSADSYICHVTDAPRPPQQHQQQQKRGTTDGLAFSRDTHRFPASLENASQHYVSPKAAPETGASAFLSAYEGVSDDCYPREQQPCESWTSGGDTAKVTTLENCELSSPIPQLHGRTAKRGTATPGSAAASPFIFKSTTDSDAADGDSVFSPEQPSSPTLAGVATTRSAAGPNAGTDAVEQLPRNLLKPQKDQVRGCSVIQISSASTSSPSWSAAAAAAAVEAAEDDAKEAGSLNGDPLSLYSAGRQRTAAELVVDAPGSERNADAHSRPLPPLVRGVPAKRASTAPPLPPSQRQQQQRETAAAQAKTQHNSGSNDEGGALVTAVSGDASSIATYMQEDSMKELVSHVDRDSYGFDLREALQAIDFAALLNEYRQDSSVESQQLQDCRHLFRVIAKNKDALSAEDVYDLLVLFTPCGAAFREGADFLWENCEGKSSLSFEDFLRYGPRLRARLRGYELFSQLSDHDRLLVIHRRALPAEPLVEANVARLRLLQLADEQLQGTMRPQTRPLRLYEELFLVDYQEMLYKTALIPASEVPLRAPDGDYAHDPYHTLPQLSVPVLQRENTDWRANAAGGPCAASSSAAPADQRRQYVVAHNEGDPSNQVSPVHGDANQSGHGPQQQSQQQSRPQGKAGVRGPANTTTTKKAANRGFSLYDSNGVHRARNGENLAVTLQCRPRADMRKNLGRFVEEEYWERRTLDDHLITQLQNMYSMH